MIRRPVSSSRCPPSSATADCALQLGIDTAMGAEAFRIVANGANVRITGGDARGLIYGALEACTQLLDGRPLYEDMPLTAYNGNSFDANPNNLFHWARVRDEVARDIDVARVAKQEPEP
jgi:hypothetical protein